MIVYSTLICPACKRLKAWLNEHSVRFEEVDLSADPCLVAKVVSESGAMTVPQAKIDGKFYVGYDAIVERLKNA